MQWPMSWIRPMVSPHSLSFSYTHKHFLMLTFSLTYVTLSACITYISRSIQSSETNNYRRRGTREVKRKKWCPHVAHKKAILFFNHLSILRLFLSALWTGIRSLFACIAVPQMAGTFHTYCILGKEGQAVCSRCRWAMCMYLYRPVPASVSYDFVFCSILFFMQHLAGPHCLYTHLRTDDILAIDDGHMWPPREHTRYHHIWTDAMTTPHSIWNI